MCRPGTAPEQNRTGQSIAVCLACPSGHYCPGGAARKPCPVGASSGKGAVSVEECMCLPGFKALHAATQGTRCEPCPHGRKKVGFGNSDCTKCEPGSVAVNGSSSCTACLPGRVSNTAALECLHCSPGRHQPKEGQTSCLECSAGSQPNRNGHTCQACPKGSYSSAGDAACLPCYRPYLLIDNVCHWFHLLLGAWLIATVTCCLIWRWCYLERKQKQAAQKKAGENWNRITWSLHVEGLQKDDDWLVLWAFSKLQKAQGNVDRPWQAEAVDKKLDEVKQHSISLGISLNYILGDFENHVDEQKHCPDVVWTKGKFGLESMLREECSSLDEAPLPPPDDPNFHQIAPLLAHGKYALGKGRFCPRDGKVDCSIVDALYHKKLSARANQFASWVWGYKISIMISALKQWLKRAGDLPEPQNIWWCFFCNNQFRVILSEADVSTEDLAQAFRENLQRVGKMWMVMDKWHGSDYVKRLWCVFEVHVACAEDIPCQVLIPSEHDEDACKVLTSESSIMEIYNALKVNAQSASASKQADADGIRRIIQKGKDFNEINKTVERQLRLAVMDALVEAATATTSPDGGEAGQKVQLPPQSPSGPPAQQTSPHPPPHTSSPATLYPINPSDGDDENFHGVLPNQMPGL